jgi:hypothetical protein
MLFVTIMDRRCATDTRYVNTGPSIRSRNAAWSGESASGSPWTNDSRPTRPAPVIGRLPIGGRPIGGLRSEMFSRDQERERRRSPAVARPRAGLGEAVQAFFRSGWQGGKASAREYPDDPDRTVFSTIAYQRSDDRCCLWNIGARPSPCVEALPYADPGRARSGSTCRGLAR